MPYNSKEKLRLYLEKNKEHIKQLHVVRARRWQENSTKKRMGKKKQR
jgi:hypothetical protein